MSLISFLFFIFISFSSNSYLLHLRRHKSTTDSNLKKKNGSLPQDGMRAVEFLTQAQKSVGF